MTQAAARNFHTATIYFRVLESLVPRLSKVQLKKLLWKYKVGGVALKEVVVYSIRDSNSLY